MRIVIDSVLTSNPYRVTFTTQYGSCEGTWVDENEPIVGEKYYVEVDIDENLVWGKTIFEHDESNKYIGIDNKNVCIIGQVENVDNDLFTIRLYDIISVIVKGRFNKYSKYVRLIAKEILLYNVNI